MNNNRWIAAALIVIERHLRRKKIKTKMYRSHGMRRSPGRLIGAKLSDSNWSKWHNSRKNTSNNTCWWFCQTHSKIWWWHQFFDCGCQPHQRVQEQHTVYSIHVRHEGTTHAHIHTSLLVSMDIHRHIQIYTHTPSHTLMTHIFSKTGFTDQSFIHMFFAMHVDPWTFNRQLACWYWEGQTH